MENQPLLKATITIDEITNKDDRWKIKAREGQSYSFFENKANSKEKTMAYRQMNDMGLKSGMSVNIGYSETPGSYQGKSITYRNIKFFSEASVQVENEPDFDEIREQKAKEIKEAQEIRAKEFDRLIEAIDKLTNKIDELLGKKKDDINTDDIPF